MARGLLTIISVIDDGTTVPQYTLTVEDSTGVTIGDNLGARTTGANGAIYYVSDVPDGVTIEVQDILDEAEDDIFGEPLPGAAGYGTPEATNDFNQLPFDSPGWDAAIRRNFFLLDTPKKPWIQLNAAEAIGEGANPAAFTTRGGHSVQAFDDSTDESVFWEKTVTTNYLDTDLTVTIYWVSATATTNSVQWEAFWENLDPGTLDIDAESYASSKTETTTTDAISGVLNTTQISFTKVEADNIEAGNPFRLKLTRNATADNMTGDAQLLWVTIE